MPHILNVYGLPDLVEPEALAGDTVVVIDVLRASTTIIHALEAGAEQVIPCLEVEQARQLARQLPEGALLGGERGGRPIDGFDLGNSPEDYVPHVVAGKTVVFTTTNGTRAMNRATRAELVLVGAFVNATAIYQRLIGRERIHLICSGTDGEIGSDDVLLAGLLVERLQRQGGLIYRQNAQAVTAREFWTGKFAVPQAIGAEPLQPETLFAELCKSPGTQRKGWNDAV